ncbi:MAG: type II secretion system protein GspN [Proteobacteria bacterium]|nr:type II secretion system protein GspN [Pseudomonadota bacterium]MCP4916483.1 type II secretion system protein GspN [Pseudomonadota bacterium]
MIQKLVVTVLGIAWALMFFLLGLNLTFPGEAARDRLVYEVDDQSRGGMLLELSDVSPWRVTGATLHDVALYEVPTTRRGQTKPPELLLRADSVSARAMASKAISADVGVVLDADLYDGNLSGTVVQLDETVSDVDLVAEDLDLSRYPFEGDEWVVDVGGRVQLLVDVLFDGSDVKKSNGEVTLEIPGLEIKEGSNAMGFDLPAMVFSEAELVLDIDDGVAEVDTGSLRSDVLDADISGGIDLAMPFKRSRLNLAIELTLHDEKLETLVGLMPDIKRSKTEDGAYRGSTTGTFERPGWRWDRGASKAAAVTRTPTISRTPAIDDDPEARRTARQDRIRERRDRMNAESAERPGRADEDEYEDDEYDEYEDDEFEDEFEDDFEDERLDEPMEYRRAPPADMPDRGPIGLPEPDYDDIPPPDFEDDFDQRPPG